MQIVGYETAPGEGPAALRVADAGTIDHITLAPTTELAYSLADRHCAGVDRGDDGHQPCQRPDAPYCDAHTSVWPCARCTGQCNKPLDACEEEHAVYLAAFAPDVFKVGVTRSWRLDTRLREQGADRAAHVHTVADGRRARRIEAGIADRITDRVRVPTKRRGLGATLDRTAWRDLVSDFDPIDEFDFDYGLDVDSRPVAETMLTGTVRATKGRLLVLDRRETTYGVDMRALVGHEITPGADDRDRQASLTAF
ncbi:DUF2797 domain-containing protein [Halobacterium salinarum]|uniref:DUF2797 family protein n=5 Tax=Halobacterium salinarum TaxID=2242 RepID=A0A510N549_HALSA|nr:DUF2797 domain-containing protein [Halobacterium salinarum]MBB6089946.1 hypothetical protein [Halobacterium salinarum]MDL0120663.1 DUF2797 domain-containing protein [Halobacterium salinarum]MDL0123896.1 DUF2797 domain-containing protein [Halobacterium salinarum]MDL0130540.1 DUF2797 domain-containing protein [Halobacterium salinarum]MDL0136498.1 DUF2797 domain-containing protein [Halobacterium salinarum]